MRTQAYFAMDGAVSNIEHLKGRISGKYPLQKEATENCIWYRIQDTLRAAFGLQFFVHQFNVFELTVFGRVHFICTVLEFSVYSSRETSTGMKRTSHVEEFVCACLW